MEKIENQLLGFNPLERGNSNQIEYDGSEWWVLRTCFNPLERGNSNQIIESIQQIIPTFVFQSPRTGKFESNMTAGEGNVFSTFSVSIP